MKATLLTLALLLGFGAWVPTAGAAEPTEFNQDFYNAHRCMRVEESNRSGTRVITARNRCNAQVAALVCYRILKESRNYGETGWHCEFSDLYGPNVERVASRGGIYHPAIKTAACAASKLLCVHVLRSIETKVRDSRSDPEPIAVDLRREFGLLN